MDEFWDQFERLRRAESRVAMATLVATRGTTPKKEGAKMWVGEGGRILGSVTIGGCVDARVVAESDEILATGLPKRLTMALGDEEAWDLGLTCSGTVEVLIEPLRLDEPDPVVQAYDRIRAEVEAGRSAVAVTPLDASHARLIVLQDGTRLGTLGSEALDTVAAEKARELIRLGQSRTLPLPLEETGMDASGSEGAAAEAFFEVHGPAASLVVFGASAVAIPLVSLARTLGYHTTVVDARPRFATPERFPDAHRVRVGIPSEIAAELPLGPSATVVLLAHDYKYDLPVLREVLRREVGYIGLLGSRRRGRAILDFLAEDDFSDEQLRRIHVPVGLDIGAESAAEIALSILAEAVAVRTGRSGGPLRDRQRS
jgi:xanthine dehydrogenase accessory factor